MLPKGQARWCAVLLSMGGPVTLVDVREYLYNIFSDRRLIRLPGGPALQKPLARLIALIRAGKVKRRYQAIGGGSQLYRWTRSQADHIEQALVDFIPGFKCYIGMRYFTPFIEDTIAQAYADGFRRICFLPMYPQYSTATTGSAFEIAKETMRKYRDLKAIFVEDFYDDEGYVILLQKYIADNMEPGDILLFSAHSLPQRYVDEGDPYVDRVLRTASLVAGQRQHYVSFQSRSGPVKWVGPDTTHEARRLLEQNKESLFLVPISFVCDHIETLYEIDIDLRNRLQDGTGTRLRRMPMFNDDRRLAGVLASIVRRRIASHVTV